MDDRYYDEFDNKFYNPDDDDAKPGANLNWKKIQRGFKRVEDATDEAYSLEAEGYAIGTQNGEPVEEGSPYYQNNAKYYADDAGEAAQHAEEVAKSIPEDYSALSEDVSDLKNTITQIEDTLEDEKSLGSTQQSYTRDSSSVAYYNLYFSQTFKEGVQYKIVINFIAADFSGFYCGTSVSASTSGGFVDGGQIADSEWYRTSDFDIATGDTHAITFTATGNANYFRFRISNATKEFEQIIEVTVYEITNNIGKLLSDMDGLKPEYDNIVVSGINTVIGINSQKKYFNLFFMTDTHADIWDATGAFKASNIVDKSQIADAFIHGGDFLAGTYNNVGDYNNALQNIRINDFVNNKIIVAKGNHEIYDTSEKNTQFTLMYQNNPIAVVDSADPDGGYFYIDYPKTKTRIIVLNTWYDATSPTETLGSHQLAWLYQIALGNLESGYTVLVFAHNIVNNSDSTVDTNVLKPLRDLLHAFVDKGTEYGGYTYGVDANGELAAVIVGHQHSDNYSNNSGFNKIVVTRASSVDGDGYAVDIFSIDTDNHILYETRIGRGDSRMYNYGSTNSQITE